MAQTPTHTDPSVLPTADEIAGPIVEALTRLADVAEWHVRDLVQPFAIGRADAESVAAARRYLNLVNDIARRCRVVAGSCSLLGSFENGLRMDAVVRSIMRDEELLTELHFMEYRRG